MRPGVTLTVVLLLAAILLVAQPLLRDADLRTDELFFSTPVRKGSYLWGRAVGGAIVLDEMAPGLRPVREAAHELDEVSRLHSL